MKPRTKSTVLLLGFIVVFVCCQQNLDAPNLNQIGKGFGLGSAQIEARVGGEAFVWQMVVASIALIVFGFLSDLTDRKILLVAATIMSGAAYLAAGLSRTVEQFIALRALAGIGIGGMVPVVFSVIGDIFTTRTRAAATGIFMAVANIGYGVGFIIGGTIGAQSALGWRTSFAMVGLLLLGFGLAFLTFGKLPPRGAADGAGSDYQGRIRFSDVRRILTNRTNLVFVVSSVVATAPLGYFQRFMADYFAVDVGLGEGGGTLILLLVLSGALLGDLLGGIIGDALHRRNRRGPPLFAAAALFCGAGLYFAFFSFRYAAHPGAAALILPIALGFCAAALVEIPTPVSKAIMLDVNVPENRGTIAALIQITAQVGYGLGALIGTLGSRLSALSTVPGASFFNFKLATLFFLPVALAWLVVVRSAPRDEQRIEALMHARPGAPKT